MNEKLSMIHIKRKSVKQSNHLISDWLFYIVSLSLGNEWIETIKKKKKFMKQIWNVDCLSLFDWEIYGCSIYLLAMKQ